jgi:hypothetical protein
MEARCRVRWSPIGKKGRAFKVQTGVSNCQIRKASPPLAVNDTSAQCLWFDHRQILKTFTDRASGFDCKEDHRSDLYHKHPRSIKMLEVRCEGTPTEIGIQHGTAATKQINGSITFYAGLFKKYTGKESNDVLLIAQNFATNIQQKWPRYYDEIEGIARGAGRVVLEIVALNVRTEIAFGLLSKNGRSDGCTTVAWQSRNRCMLGQNWD